MQKPLTKKELEKIKLKYSEKKIFNVIDAQRNKNSASIEEEKKEIVVNSNESIGLEHLSSKQESIMDILKILSTPNDKKKISISDIDWTKVKTL